MNVSAEIELGFDNLEETYLAIGGATPEAVIQRREGYSLCLGRLDHPIGNFAIVRRMSMEAATDLGVASRERQAFNVYAPAARSPERTAKVLASVGFRPSYRLVVMASPGVAHPSECALVPALTGTDRERVGVFMTRQFFTRQRTAIQTLISRATAQCGLDLFDLCWRGQAVGAAMITRTPGILGIYNLCIESSKRGRGIGSEAVRRLLELAHNEGRIAVLQADPTLEEWYGSLGFATHGEVQVFAGSP